MIQIFDTTLRDGEQSPGCSMNLQEKLQMAKQLERLGVDCIEAGFAAASPGDFKAIEEISKALKKTRITSLARCKEADIDAAARSLEKAKKKRIHLFIATSPIHMDYKLKMTQEEVLASIRHHVAYGKKLVDDIEFSAEDATRSDPDFLVEVYRTAYEAGARTLNIPDTVGYITPNNYYRLVKKIKDSLEGKEVVLSVHAHNDLGLALANTLAAIEAGARQAEVTLNGIGERCGNAALEELVMALYTRQDVYQLETGIVKEEIMASSQLLSQITGVKPAPTKPIVGANAFSHESGIHQDGILKHKETYEILKPEMIGRKPDQGLVLGKHSGKHALKDKLQDLGYSLNERDLDEVFHKFKDLADQKKTIYDSDLHALILGEYQTIDQGYKLKDYYGLSSQGPESKVIIKLSKDDKDYEFVGTGKGPIDAAFDGLIRFTRQKARLKDFKIFAITQGKDALGEAVLSLEIEDQSYRGKGISNDIIKSSILAYINAMNKKELDDANSI